METAFSLVCETCGKTFQRRATEHRRNQRVGRKTYCSRRCVGVSGHAQLKPFEGQHPERLRADNRRDEFTRYRVHLTRARKRGKPCTCTLQDLQTQWERQGGRCAYTVVILESPSSSRANNPIVTASLDRIDSKQGYVPGNIQFISVAANNAKGRMSHEQMLEFCHLIAAAFRKT